MIHTIGTIIKTVLKWAAFLFVILVLLRLLSFVFPWFTQNNIKDKIEGNATSTKTGFKFPSPGSWSIMGTGTANIAKPKINPSLPDSYFDAGYQSPSIPK